MERNAKTSALEVECYPLVVCAPQRMFGWFVCLLRWGVVSVGKAFSDSNGKEVSGQHELRDKSPPCFV